MQTMTKPSQTRIAVLTTTKGDVQKSNIRALSLQQSAVAAATGEAAPAAAAAAMNGQKPSKFPIHVLIR